MLFTAFLYFQFVCTFVEWSLVKKDASKMLVKLTKVLFSSTYYTKLLSKKMLFTVFFTWTVAGDEKAACKCWWNRLRTISFHQLLVKKMTVLNQVSNLLQKLLFLALTKTTSWCYGLNQTWPKCGPTTYYCGP